MPGALTWDPTPPGGSQSTARGGVNPSADGASFSPAEVAGLKGVVSGDRSLPERMVGYELEQPAAVTKAVTKFGKLAARFGTGQWTATTGAPTLTQGYTGWDGAGAKTGIVSRTGQPDMLKVVPAANTTEVISLGTFATNMLTKNLGGKFGLWVYVENKPGYDTGAAGAGGFSFEMGTNADNSNPLSVTFTGNQVREGWNFLTFVMRDPLAYVDASGVTEYHPYGIVAANFGTGANANIKDNAIAYIRISWDNMLGATLYFDSMWTGFESKAQVVLGCDSGINLETIAAPIFDSYGWVGYLAMPYRIWSSGSYQVVDLDSTDGTDVAQMLRMYGKGWEMWNHTVNHLANAALTSEAAIAYELQTSQAWQYENDMPRGAEFYASPQSSTSRLSEKVIKGLGFKLQRHARRWNVTPTPFGIDNPHHVGSLDISSNASLAYGVTTSGAGSSVTGLQTATKIKRCIDIAVAYGATIFPFWHGITTSGDSGSGEDLTGDNLLITSSAFAQSMAYIRQLEQAGSLTVCKGGAGFYYGSN